MDLISEEKVAWIKSIAETRGWEWPLTYWHAICVPGIGKKRARALQAMGLVIPDEPKPPEPSPEEIEKEREKHRIQLRRQKVRAIMRRMKRQFANYEKELRELATKS